MRASVPAFSLLASSYLDVNRALAAEIHASDPTIAEEAVLEGLIPAFPVPMDYGCDEGDACKRNGCGGEIVHHKYDGSCTCHLGCPPCGWCTSGFHTCDSCDWEDSYHC